MMNTFATIVLALATLKGAVAQSLTLPDCGVLAIIIDD